MASIEEYTATGVTAIRSLLRHEQVEQAQNWLWRIVDQGNQISPELQPEFEEGKDTEIAIRKLRRLYWHDIRFWSTFFEETDISSLAHQFIASDLALIFHAAFLKPARVGSAVVLHQDQALWEHSYPRAISLWIALEPAHRQNGGLIGCPGSHQFGLLRHQPVQGHSWHNGVDWRAERLEMPRNYILDPGDALVWHRYFVHGSQPNSSEHSRWGMVFVFADRRLPNFYAKDSVLL
jgi:hypothetical protein